MLDIVRDPASFPALYPPTVTPPAQPLPIHRFLVSFLRNPVRSLPQPAYEQPVTVLKTRRATVAWVCEPALVDEALTRQHDTLAKTPIEKRAFKAPLGDGVLTADGPLWRWQRRIMAPLFRPADILAYVPEMARAAEEQLAAWRNEPAGSSQAIDQAMVETTFKIIARTTLAGGMPEEHGIIKQATALYLSRIQWEMAYGSLGLPEWLPHPGSLRMRRAARELRAAVGRIVARRRKQGMAGDDLIWRLLVAKDPDSAEPMNDAQIINNLLTLLEAGHETTTRALTWTLYLLARAPHWQEAARQEVMEVAGSFPIEARHLEDLRLTQQVLKEAMRLYPPVPVIARISVKPLQIGGEKFAPGSLIVIPIYCIHRHRALWREPDRFDPSRFAAGRENQTPRTQFMPFGAGPRICMGASFAMMEATVVLATLLRSVRFDWDGRQAPEPVSRITLRPSEEIWLNVTPL